MTLVLQLQRGMVPPGSWSAGGRKREGMRLPSINVVREGDLKEASSAGHISPSSLPASTATLRTHELQRIPECGATGAAPADANWRPRAALPGHQDGWGAVRRDGAPGLSRVLAARRGPGCAGGCGLVLEGGVGLRG